MQYNIQRLPELGWYVLGAALVYLAQQIGQQDYYQITDWGAWSVALLANTGRVGVAAIGSWATTKLFANNE